MGVPSGSDRVPIKSRVDPGQVLGRSLASPSQVFGRFRGIPGESRSSLGRASVKS
jgi:hypothetical protein